MKTVCSFIAITLISISSMACPNLTGKWTCQTSDGEAARVNLTSVNKEDSNFLILVNDVGTPVQTSATLALNVGKQIENDYSYSATCGNNYVAIDLETAFGPVSLRYTLKNASQLLINTASQNADYNSVISCKKLSL